MQRIRIIIFLAASFFIISSGAAQTIYSDYKDGKLYVILEKEHIATTENATAFLDTLDWNVQFTSARQPFTIESDTLSRTWQVSFKPADKVDLLIRQLSQLPQVEFAERIPLTKTFLTPNDPMYSSTIYGYDWNWHLDMIRAEAAWDITTGSPNIVVAIVDNAVYTDHPDLAGKFIKERDISNNDNDASPPSGGSSSDKYIWSHGTHCAGLAAAKTNNDTGVAGIGYDISLMGIKTAPDSSSGEYTYNGIGGVQWAAQNGADIISASWGSTGFSSVNNNFYTSVKNNGIIIVAAAGNEGDAGNEKLYPAAYNSVIAVGSTNADDERSSFSQYGDWLDVSAPGGYSPNGTASQRISLLSTTFNDAYYTQNIFSGKYDISQGTSMSTPIVAGLLGLMKSLKPSASFSDLKNCLLWGADNIDSVNLAAYAGKMGSGRINAVHSLNCLTGSSINVADQNKKLKIYPNPSRGTFHIQSPGISTFELSVFDITGKEIARRSQSGNMIDLNHLNSGIYIIKIKTKEQSFTEKVVIQP
ncbi:MAG: S8 family peptidase [Bacteroidales bacterium]|nr:S8 family peptidase [Bacteroidales bacterium]MCF8327236.1 S8 family peptidase [Bacteroidales bacterium]